MWHLESNTLLLFIRICLLIRSTSRFLSILGKTEFCHSMVSNYIVLSVVAATFYFAVVVAKREEGMDKQMGRKVCLALRLWGWRWSNLDGGMGAVHKGCYSLMLKHGSTGAGQAQSAWLEHRCLQNGNDYPSFPSVICFSSILLQYASQWQAIHLPRISFSSALPSAQKDAPTFLSHFMFSVL